MPVDSHNTARMMTAIDGLIVRARWLRARCKYTVVQVFAAVQTTAATMKAVTTLEIMELIEARYLATYW